MNSKEGLHILARYVILFVLALGNLFLFYAVFTPLTVYPIFFLLNLFSKAVLLPGSTIFFNQNYIDLISACIAGAAYYLLTILNLSTPMNIRKRIKSLAFLYLSFLIVNIIRILVFAALVSNEYFDISHKITWYLGSTIMIIALWFANVRIFNINAIPVYTDIHSLIKEIKGKRGEKRKNRK